MRRENNKIKEEGTKKIEEGILWRRMNIKMKRRGVSKTLFGILKRASLPLPSVICTICPLKISEPELVELQQQEVGLACIISQRPDFNAHPRRRNLHSNHRRSVSNNQKNITPKRITLSQSSGFSGNQSKFTS